MTELVKLELFKLCRKKLTLIVTISCFFATFLFFSLPFIEYKAWDETGTMLSGRKAVSYKQDCYKKIAGTLTEERIAKDLTEFQNMYSNEKNLITERGGEKSFKDEIYYRYLAPKESYLNMLGNTFVHNEMGYLNIPDIAPSDTPHFYQARNYNVNQYIDSLPQLSSTEKQYWKEKNKKIAEPYEYGCPLGWSNFGDTSQMLIICIFGICIAVAPIFSNEYQTGADAVILSTRFGKSKIAYAKIITALLFGSIVLTVNAAAALLLPLLAFGADGGNLPLQIMDSFCPYDLTFMETAFIILAISYLTMLGLLAITLYCSSKAKSSFTVLTADVLLIFFPVFLSSGSNDIWNHIYMLLPYQALSGLSIFQEYLSYHLGNAVLPLITAIIPVYAIIIFLSVIFAGKNFCKHQVQ